MRNVSGVMVDHAWLTTGRKMAENVENTVRNGGIAGGDRGYDEGRQCSQNLGLGKGRLFG